MERIQEHNELILEFARINKSNDKYIPSSQFEVILHDGNETGKHNIPHFHVNSKNGEFNISVKLLNYDPLSINDIEIIKESGNINNRRKFLEKLLNWLKSLSKSEINTNMKFMYDNWNERFPSIKLPKWLYNDDIINNKKDKIFKHSNEYCYLNDKDFVGSYLPYDKYYVFIDTSLPDNINVYDIEKDEILIIDDNVDKNNYLYKLYDLWLKDIYYSDKDFETNEEYVGYITYTNFYYISLMKLSTYKLIWGGGDNIVKQFSSNI